MKVHDIRSFFKKPGGGGGGNGNGSPEQAVDIPSRLKKGGSKKKSKDDRLNVSIEGSDDSDNEDPLPKEMRKRVKDKKGESSRSRSGKAVVVQYDEEEESDGEDPLPKSSRSKFKEKEAEKKRKATDKKRKARVLSDSDEDDGDDFKSSKKKSTSTREKPATKLAKIEKPQDTKKKEEVRQVINPADFFSSAPVKRETKEKEKKVPEKEKKQSPNKSSPEKSKDTKKSPSKAAVSPHKSSGKSKTHDGEKDTSPHRPPTSIIEPKKLKMPTPTPEKEEKAQQKPSKSPASTDNKTESKSKASTESQKTKKTPEKKAETSFKVPTPVTTEKSKSRTGASSSAPKRSVKDDDDEEEDFNPKKKATTPSKGKQGKDKPSKREEQTPAKDTDDDDDKEKKKATTPQQKQNYMKYLAKKSMKPKNLGSKEIPEGAPNCLQGLAFVISGELDSIERDDCKDIIVKYGGRVTTAVSGKTSYLIIGDDPGEGKLKRATQLKIPQIDEDGFLDMLRKSNPNGNSQDSGLAYSESVGEDSEMKVDSEYDPDMSLFESPATKKRTSPRKAEPSKLAKEESPKKPKLDAGLEVTTVKKETEVATSSKSNPVPGTPPKPQAVPADLGLMWVDKYKPKTLKTVVGQASETSNAKKLVRWLNNWFNFHGTSQDKPKAAWPGLRDPEGKTFKAALLSGPPGIGKTTTAHLSVKEVGYDYFEMNASDTRNKRGLHENVADALSCKSLVFSKGSEEMTRKHVLIMDEVDGMSGNEDRGGVQELIALIKNSRVPIICICNDRNHPKIRSLANYCYDLRFNKPTFEQLKGFVMSICYKEKIKVPQEKISQLIASTDQDVRQILHQLELYKEGKSDQAYNPKKDLKFGPWDVIRKVFHKAERSKMSIHDKNGLFFQDYNIGPLFVQENYVNWIPDAAKGNRHKHMDLLGQTAASLADGDLVETTIRRSQNWGLLPVQAVFASYMPGEYMESSTMGGVEFPKWLGKNSNKNKRHRNLQSLHQHLHLQVSGSLEALNMDYLPYLRRSVTTPLVKGDHESAAEIMENYTLLRDDVESIVDLSLWPGTKDPMEKVETRVKSAFTRLVNKEILPYSNAKPVKGRGRGGSAQEDELEALMEEGDGEAVEEIEEDESVEKDAMVKMRTKKAGPSKASSSTSKKGKKGKGYDDEDDEDEDDRKASKGKGSKSKQPTKSRKGK